jgi:hypothetical protein
MHHRGSHTKYVFYQSINLEQWQKKKPMKKVGLLLMDLSAVSGPRHCRSLKIDRARFNSNPLALVKQLIDKY